MTHKQKKVFSDFSSYLIHEEVDKEEKKTSSKGGKGKGKGKIEVEDEDEDEDEDDDEDKEEKKEEKVVKVIARGKDLVMLYFLYRWCCR